MILEWLPNRYFASRVLGAGIPRTAQRTATAQRTRELISHDTHSVAVLVGLIKVGHVNTSNRLM